MLKHTVDRKDEHGPGAVVVSDAGVERCPVRREGDLGPVLEAIV